MESVLPPAIPPAPAKSATLSRRKLSQIHEFIESRLESNLTLLDLATESGFSRSHFLRVFHATTGLTPHLYVLKRRIERARQLLEQRNLSIAEIVYKCGFSNQAHLTMAFRKEYGVYAG